ncbi:membrane protease YdiL (CAAX protease family) [Streptomyces sp. DSM 42143]|uniref:CPBP family intramembrane glutamic endopeptidase n=1 Tax=Streptomyces TaxID=1883 RepID=UPI000BD7DD02|nr:MULTISPECIES: CPBP family intramembrane glutamic endopeptidase [unclassified Streptomyces]MDN3245892.1 CPBP family intramembrane metalloprotease [Streptomyces sp. ZSW22]MDQ0383380.1 membrane protease YdiL (CAAX protease family) [Streptomyces sp. DSM 42143]PAK27953.1 CPBP family intramembrane metalloprotease [Streptomyces sp. alain-838]
MGTTSAVRHSAGSGPGEDRDRGGGRFGRIVRTPLGWMLAGMVGVGLVSGLTATGPGPVPVLGAVAAVAVYCCVMRRVARRSTPEIARSGAGREVLLGGGIGLGFVLASALVVTAFGGYSFSWAGDGFVSVVWPAAAVQIGAAVTEELMFRGLALQALEKLWGSGAAIVITSLFFGVAHLGAPGANAWSGVAIALEAGVLLGAAFLWRRNIWFVVGLHFAWNTTQELLGIPVSGHTPEGLFTVDVHGSTLLHGGDFGLETSIVPVLVGVALAVSMLVLAHRNGGIKTRRRASR